MKLCDKDTFKNSEYKYTEEYDLTLESIIIFEDIEETI